MNIETIQAAVFSWANAALNADPAAPTTTVYWDEPEAPKPAAPALRLNLIAGPTMFGLDELRSVAGDADAFEIVGPRSFMLSVTAFGSTAFQLIADLQTSISDPTQMQVLEAANVAVLSTSSPRDVTVPLETKFETRAQIDVTLLATEDKVVTPGVIGKVAIDSTVGSETGQIIDNGGS